MYRNNLKKLMIERNISNNKLAKETSISQQAISKIKNNEFHDISINVLTELLEYLDVTFDEFGTIYTRNECLQALLPDKGFTNKNLQLLESLISKNLQISCTYYPYSNNQSLNIYSKKLFKKFDFSGNFRVNTSLNGLTFEVIDFDLYLRNKKMNFDDFYRFCQNFFNQLECYASHLGFTQIAININPYIDDNLSELVDPRDVNIPDLKFLIAHSNYSDRENELIKMSIIKNRHYREFSHDYAFQTANKKINTINHYIDSLPRLNFFEKEKRRLSMLSEKNIHSNHYTKIFFKQLNPEIIPKEKLEKDMLKR